MGMVGRRHQIARETPARRPLALHMAWRVVVVHRRRFSCAGCCAHLGQNARMPLLLSDRAVTSSPVSLITTSEARMLGVSLAPHTMRRIRRGIYVRREEFDHLPPWTKYAVRVHAFARLHPDAILCLESAAVPHGLPGFGETADIHVFDPQRSRSRRFGDVFVHASHEPRDMLRVNGVLVTGIRDTIIDLSRVLPPARALAVADSTISPAQGGPLSLDELRANAETQRNRRGRNRSRLVWTCADGRAESPGESVSRAVIAWNGFETPELQRVFRYDGFEDRVDFFFPSNHTIGESDGWGKYVREDPDEAAQILRAEKLREERLRRNQHPFARWDLAGAQKVDPLVRALESAGLQRIRAAQPEMLATLKDRTREKQRPQQADTAPSRPRATRSA